MEIFFDSRKSYQKICISSYSFLCFLVYTPLYTPSLLIRRPYFKRRFTHTIEIDIIEQTLKYTKTVLPKERIFYSRDSKPINIRWIARAFGISRPPKLVLILFFFR